MCLEDGICFNKINRIRTSNERHACNARGLGISSLRQKGYATLRQQGRLLLNIAQHSLSTPHTFCNTSELSNSRSLFRAIFVPPLPGRSFIFDHV